MMWPMLKPSVRPSADPPCALFPSRMSSNRRCRHCTHRAREGFIVDRTATANRIRGLMAEYGLIIPQGIGHVRSKVPELIEDATNELPGMFRRLIDQLLNHLRLY